MNISKHLTNGALKITNSEHYKFTQNQPTIKYYINAFLNNVNVRKENTYINIFPETTANSVFPKINKIINEIEGIKQII